MWVKNKQIQEKEKILDVFIENEILMLDSDKLYLNLDWFFQFYYLL